MSKDEVIDIINRAIDPQRQSPIGVAQDIWQALEDEGQLVSVKEQSENKMGNPVPTVTISEGEYKRLLERDHWLNCLEAAGIDNTDAYECAQDIRDEATDE